MAATIFAANESTVQVNGTPLEGVRAVDYRFQQARDERLRARLARARRPRSPAPSPSRDGSGSPRRRPCSTALVGDATFQICSSPSSTATTTTEVAFDECFLTEKSFDLSVGGHGEATYTFTAIRVR